MANSSFIENLRFGVVAGVAGGLAEMGWVTLYAGATGLDAAEVARGVTTAAGVDALLPTMQVGTGIAIHMTLAVMLGIAFTFTWRLLSSRWQGFANPLPFALVALAGVWVLNFFVLLPAIGPAFLHLLPYGASFVSKMLFGAAAGGALIWQSASITNATIATSNA